MQSKSDFYLHWASRALMTHFSMSGLVLLVWFLYTGPYLHLIQGILLLLAMVALMAFLVLSFLGFKYK